MKHKIVLIPGDGIGPEVTRAAKKCVEATGVDIQWEVMDAGEAVIKEYGTPLPQAVLDSIRRNGVALKGPVSTPIGKGFRSVNVALRKALGLYACVRPCKLYNGVKTRYEDIDLVVIRENTEDLYAGIEFERGSPDAADVITLLNKLSKDKLTDDSALTIKPISRAASERIARFAFEYALKHKRKKVTAVHKANIMKCTDGLFLESAREVSKDYIGDIEFEDKIVDNMCMQLVQKPNDYDVLVAPNIYGDILSDLCAGLVGGLGVAPGANIGKDIAVFEPTHGSAPKYKGLDKMNPSAMIFSACMMLQYIGEGKAAKRLEGALAEVIREGKSVTYDLKENRNDPQAVGTSRMADAVIGKLKR